MEFILISALAIVVLMLALLIDAIERGPDVAAQRKAIQRKARDARFFDNRSPFEWERVEPARPVAAFVTDEMEGRA